jgi:hypothetical protein
MRRVDLAAIVAALENVNPVSVLLVESTSMVSAKGQVILPKGVAGAPRLAAEHSTGGRGSDQRRFAPARAAARSPCSKLMPQSAPEVIVCRFRPLPGAHRSPNSKVDAICGFL